MPSPDPLYYLLSEHRPDLGVADSVVVEVKAVERFDAIHTAQMLTYLRVTGLRLKPLCLCASVARLRRARLP